MKKRLLTVMALLGVCALTACGNDDTGAAVNNNGGAAAESDYDYIKNNGKMVCRRFSRIVKQRFNRAVCCFKKGVFRDFDTIGR